MYKTYMIAAILAAFSFIQTSFSQCNPDEVTVQLELLTDYYGYETTYTVLLSNGDTLLSSNGNVLENETLYIETFCLASDQCAQLVLQDEYGDGFTGNGNARLLVNGEEVILVDDFDFLFNKFFNCGPGFSCDDAIAISDTDFVQSVPEKWYTFSVPEIGQYEITTCDNSPECNTAVFIYRECPLAAEDSVEGTLFYNDESLSCGERAVAIGSLDVDKTYFLRIKKSEECELDINISINYLGPVEGCMDPEACNFNPLAQVDDGSCVPFGDVDCPEGPDLRLNPFTLASSMYATVLNTDNECLINEGCLKGVGRRDIIRFTTRIENIGTQDYFIGDPQEQPGQYTYDNCHNHYHYDGYAQYSLYDTYGQHIPIGNKNGFCVLDISCPSEDMYQYTCDYMGISAGCFDEYDSGIDCQWMDITDVPDGDYVFVAIVNVDLARDALGRAEKDTLNNHAQVSINIDRSSGEVVLTKYEDGEIYTDCNGEIYGKALRDCEGNCDGTRVRGDRNLDQIHDINDVQYYIDEILTGGEATDCSDLFDDDVIDVYDASVLHNCVMFGMEHEHESGTAAHDHCYFPTGLYNFLDTMEFNMKYDKLNDPENIYVDITNPSDGLMAFQFALEGVEIEAVYQNTVISDQIFDIQFDNETGMIVGAPIENYFLERSNLEQGLLRIKVNPMDTILCLAKDPIMVGSNIQKTAVKVISSCAPTDYSSIDQLVDDPRMEVYPIPTESILNVSIKNDAFKTQNISCYAADGQLVYNEDTSTKNASINVKDWKEGMYFVIVTGNDKQFIKKFIVHDKK